MSEKLLMFPSPSSFAGSIPEEASSRGAVCCSSI